MTRVTIVEFNIVKFDIDNVNVLAFSIDNCNATKFNIFNFNIDTRLTLISMVNKK